MAQTAEDLQQILLDQFSMYPDEGSPLDNERVKSIEFDINDIGKRRTRRKAGNLPLPHASEMIKNSAIKAIRTKQNRTDKDTEAFYDRKFFKDMDLVCLVHIHHKT